jgi:hypothetical protein
LGLDRRQDRAQALGEVIRGQRLAGLGQRERALDLVLELAHVAGPGMRLEQALGLGREPHARLGFRAPVELEEMPREAQHVARAFAQRRDVDRASAQVFRLRASRPKPHSPWTELVRVAEHRSDNANRLYSVNKLSDADLSTNPARGW